MNELPLRDIHLPAAVSAWPPAIGWWILAALMIAILIAAVLFYKHHKNKTPKPAYKKIALKELFALQKQYQGQPNSIELLRSISALLRRIALSYLPRETVAGLTGEEWIKQLNALSNSTFNKELGQLLANAPYRAEAIYDDAALLQQCEQWIKNLSHNRNENTAINNAMETRTQ